MESIVLAEDHQLMIEGYQHLINEIEDLEVVATACDGQEAIDAVKKHKPDYLILDLNMPNVNGLEALRHISEYHPETRVIIISMFGDIAIHREVMKLGARGYILKHADHDEFIMAIKMVMRGKSYYSAEIFEERQAVNDVSNGKAVIPLVSLTPREEEILMFIARGHSTREIAKKLIVSYKTIDNHRTNLMKKIQVHNIAGLVKYALANGYDV